jgi:hypothetical protein
MFISRMRSRLPCASCCPALTGKIFDMSYLFKHGFTPEEREQAAFFRWLRRFTSAYPDLAKIYHTPNGGWRHAATARKIKLMGGVPGVPDVTVPIPARGYHSLWLEFKYGRNRLTPHQKDFAAFLTQHDHAFYVVRSAEEAAEIIAEYLDIPILRMPTVSVSTLFDDDT